MVNKVGPLECVNRKADLVSLGFDRDFCECFINTHTDEYMATCLNITYMIDRCKSLDDD